MVSNIFLLLQIFIVNLISYHEIYAMRRSTLLMRTVISETKASAFELAKASPIKMPSIILVNPFLDANVGSVSRAMLNFGLYDLRIVNPECDILSVEAKRLAVGSIEILENAKIFSNLKECVSDLQRVVATTARSRDMILSLHTAESICKEIVGSSFSTGIMFGRERMGLTNEELSYADACVAIPANEHYSVLNLAQAVNIIGYEACKQKRFIESSRVSHLHIKQGDEELADRRQLNAFLSRLEASLSQRNFKAQSLNNNVVEKQSGEIAGFQWIRSMIQRAGATDKEVKMLHGVLTALEKPPSDDRMGHL